MFKIEGGSDIVSWKVGYANFNSPNSVEIFGKIIFYNPKFLVKHDKCYATNSTRSEICT